MRIRLKSNFDIDDVFVRGEVELESQNATVRTLLDDLSNRCQHKIEFIDPETDEVDSADFEIMVNGSGYSFLPNRLNTKLRHDDQVEIILISLGGG